MGYFIEFWTRSGQYSWLRVGDSPSNAARQAKRIISEFFPNGSHLPVRDADGFTIPSAVKISDEHGKTLGKWSMDEEVEARKRASRALGSNAPFSRRARGAKARV